MIVNAAWWFLWILTLLFHVMGMVFTIHQLRSPWRFPRWSAAWRSMLALIIWMGLLRFMLFFDNTMLGVPQSLELSIGLVTSVLAFTTALLFSRMHQPTHTLPAIHPAEITIDEHSVIRVWNDRATDLFGFTATEILGQSLTLIMPVRHHQAHMQGMEHWLSVADPTQTYAPFSYDIEACQKDGGEFMVHIVIITQYTDKGWQFHGTIRRLLQV